MNPPALLAREVKFARLLCADGSSAMRAHHVRALEHAVVVQRVPQSPAASLILALIWSSCASSGSSSCLTAAFTLLHASVFAAHGCCGWLIKSSANESSPGWARSILYPWPGGRSSAR